MLKATNILKFEKISENNHLNKHPIFCYDYLIGMAMFNLAISVIILLTIYKPIHFFGVNFYSFYILIPFQIAFIHVLEKVYGLSISRNITFWLIILVIVYGLIARLTTLVPSATFFKYEEGYIYVFRHVIKIAAIYALAMYISLLFSNLLKFSLHKLFPKIEKYYLNLFGQVFSSFFFAYSFSIITNKFQLYPIKSSSQVLVFFLVVSLSFTVIFQNLIIKFLKKREKTQYLNEDICISPVKLRIFNPASPPSLTIINKNSFFKRFHCNYLLALTLGYMLLMLMSGVMVLRTGQFFFLTLPIGIFLTPFIYSLSNIITEIYGYSVSRNMMWWFIIISSIYSFICLLLVLDTSTNDFTFNGIYQLMLGSMPMIFIGGLLGTLVGINFNNVVVSKLKIRLAGSHYWMRSFVATAGGEIVYNFVAYPIMYYGKVSLDHFFKIFFSVALFKLLVTLLVWPIECLTASILKRKERTDVFDYDVNFNLFRLSTKHTKLRVVTPSDNNLDK